MWTHIKRTILAGVFTIVPLVLTLYILNFLFRLLNGFSKPILKFIGFHIPGLGILLTILVVYLLGLLIRNVLGRRLFTWGEKILLTIPIVNTIYKTIKQFINAFTGTAEGKNFQKVIFLQYPRVGVWTLAFVTGESVDANSIEYYHVFVPTTPNPTSGFFIMIPKKETMLTEMSVEEGIKMVISGGLIAPPENELHNFPK
ncbi:MAG TPA: DUF502 domain-containing protein [Candidatus Marinimicrobia bacterium]|nr:DUF502 domain-containing protein [Candidatus Neomarinimicrobiota bacterium]HJM69336.1 DUF502 domain-containing protein [Candidatus Neomarinimicrobiota bacterium]